MNPATTEALKWMIGLPAALMALVTLPYVITKYRLECRKLRYEIRKLEAELPVAVATKLPPMGSLATWMAFYWPIPCYASLLALGILSGVFRSPILFGLASGISLLCLITGSALGERYTRLTGRRT